jgi:hypothetical protein
MPPFDPDDSAEQSDSEQQQEESSAVGHQYDHSNPFDKYFEHQFATLQAMKVHFCKLFARGSCECVHANACMVTCLSEYLYDENRAMRG